MTKEEATAAAREWDELHSVAQSESEVGCEGHAEDLRAEADVIEQRIRAAGFEPLSLLREVRNL